MNKYKSLSAPEIKRRRAFRKANNEWQRSSGFDLMYQDKYEAGEIDMSELIAKNYQWLCDWANDCEGSLLDHMKDEIRSEYAALPASMMGEKQK